MSKPRCARCRKTMHNSAGLTLCTDCGIEAAREAMGDEGLREIFQEVVRGAVAGNPIPCPRPGDYLCPTCGMRDESEYAHNQALQDGEYPGDCSALKVHENQKPENIDWYGEVEEAVAL